MTAVLERTPGGPGVSILDIGCGTGSLALRLAEAGAVVLAVDVSAAMIDALTAEAIQRNLDSLTALTMAAEELQLDAGSVDVIVSSYALHHLRDSDKKRFVDSAARWLRPGGTLVIGDMMFGRGITARDRRIIRAKVTALLRKGPGGVWRVVKNSARFLVRMRERPLPMDAWTDLLCQAGFTDVTATPVIAEAAVVTGRAPRAA